MAGPLEGIRIVELGFWVAGPATSGILGDWGASVIKIEPPLGDPMRAVLSTAVGIDVPINPAFELDNRGKRSIVLDLKTEEGREIASALVDQADIFVTNLRASALAGFGLDYESLAARNPRLIYGAVTGYGTGGPDSDRAAYDIGAYWARGGVAAMLTPEGHEPPVQRGGMGDHATAMTAAAAINAALVSRERTGKGQYLETSLLRTGAYTVGWDLATRLRFGRLQPPSDRREAPNPIANSYQASCGKWFWLIGLQADRHWPDVCRAIEREDLIENERTINIVRRRENAGYVVGLLDEIFATRTRAQWAERFDESGVWWAPVQDCDDLADDPQLRATGGVVPFESAEGQPEQVATPVDFAGTPNTFATTSPELGQNTEEILLEMGQDWERIADLKERGIIP